MRLPLLLILALMASACDGGGTPKGGEAPSGWSGPRGAEQSAAGRLDRSKAGSPAPTAAFEDPDGEPVSLADFQGKPLLVNLWATWCAPCVAEMPTLDALAAREKELQVLTISQDMDGREKVEAFFAAREFKAIETYLDPGLAMMTELKVESLPTTILYDAKGREVWRMTGIEDWTGERAAELIKDAS